MKYFYCFIYFTTTFFFSLDQFVLANTIKKPAFSARTTTAVTVDSIQCQPELTRFYITLRYFPNSAITIGKNILLKDFSSGTIWKATDMEGGDFDRRIMIPESGESSIFIDFPVVPTTVKLVDLINSTQDFPFKIIDISLSDNIAAKKTDVSLNKFLKKSGQLHPDKCIIHVLLNGYHTRLNVDSALLIHKNIITGKQEIIKEKIDSDGQFTITIPQTYPEQQTIFLPCGYINFYSEPGNELFISANMEDLAIPYKQPENAEQNYIHLQYKGDESITNNDLKKIRIAMSRLFPSKPIEIQGLSAEQYKQTVKQLALRQQSALDSLIQKLHISPKAADIARLNLQCSIANQLLDLEYIQHQQGKTTTLPLNYYDIVSFPFDNFLSLSATGYPNLIDKLEHSPIMTNGKKSVKGNDVINAFKRLHIPLTLDEQELILYSFSMKTPSDTARIKDFRRRTKEFNQKYPAIQLAAREQALYEKYHKSLQQAFGINSNLLSEILYARRVILSIKSLGRSLSEKELATFCKPITQKYIQESIQTENLKFKLK